MNHQEIQKLIDDPAVMREILHITELDAMIKEIFPSVPLDMEYKIIEAGTWKEPRFIAENSADMTAYTGIFERALRECRLGAFGSSIGWTPEDGYRVWFQLQLNFESFDGGHNGLTIAKFRFENGQWDKCRYKGEERLS